MTEPPAVSLLPVRDLDFEALFAMFEAYCAEVEPLDPLGAPPQAPDERRETLLDGAAEEEWSWIIADGQRAGFVMVQVYEDDPSPGDRTAEVLECYVVPGSRRRGVGRAAIEAVLATRSPPGVAAGPAAAGEAAAAVEGAGGIEAGDWGASARLQARSVAAARAASSAVRAGARDGWCTARS